MFQKPVIAKIPELYPENLRTLGTLMEKLEDLSGIDGVFEIEIRVRVDDVDTWAVIGWGESGDPCVLRFEAEPKPVPTQPVVRGGFISEPSPFTTTINKTTTKCRCGDDGSLYGGSCGPNGCYNCPA